MDFIANRNYVVVIDKSGSMSLDDCKGKSRWQACQEAAYDVAETACKYDPNGITVYTFSSEGKWTCDDGVTEDKVADVFSANKPGGRTYLTQVLRDCFTKYLNRRNAGGAPGESIIIFTDGEANDKDAVVKEIHAFTHQLTADPEYSICFVQVGYDQGAAEFLAYLDDQLGPNSPNRCKFDIVDTKTLDWVNENSVTSLFAASIDD